MSEEEYGMFQNLISDAFRKQILGRPFPESPEWLKESVSGHSNEAQIDDTHMANSEDDSFDGELDDRKDFAIPTAEPVELPINFIFSPKARSFSLKQPSSFVDFGNKMIVSSAHQETNSHECV